MKNTKQKKSPTAGNRAGVAEAYKQSGLSRGEYCQRAGIPVTTLDYYLRRLKTKTPRLVPVQLSQAEPADPSGFTLVLGNGRRIECGWGFTEAGLSRLLRIAEQG